MRTFVLLASLCPVAVAGQSPAAALTPAQRAAVDAGERIVITRDRPESPWPAVSVYAYVNTTPEEAAAVFTKYERHSSYIPTVIQSRISRVIDATTVEVDYVLSVPLVRDEQYTVRNHISSDRAGGIRVDWVLVRATSTKATVGHARFAPHTNARTRRTGTLVEYHNFVTPGSRLAGLGFIRSRAVLQVDETVRAMVRQIESEQRRPGALGNSVAALRAALACSTGGAPVASKCRAH